MSKEIFLYSEDKKYKCAVELADSLDRFKCPDHSIIILTEERDNGTYVIAQARDKRLETEKDKIIADLEAKLAESEKRVIELSDGCRSIEKIKDDKIEEIRDFWMKRYEKKLKEYHKEIKQLKQQLQEIKNVKAQELADYLHTSIPKYIVNEKVELLEKVKEYADIDFRKNCYINAVELDKFIDNQIEELKKEKK